MLEQPVFLSAEPPLQPFLFSFEIGSHYAGQADLELKAILLPQCPECWDYRYEVSTSDFLSFPLCITMSHDISFVSTFSSHHDFLLCTSILPIPFLFPNGPSSFFSFLFLNILRQVGMQPVGGHFTNGYTSEENVSSSLTFYCHRCPGKGGPFLLMTLVYLSLRRRKSFRSACLGSPVHRKRKLSEHRFLGNNANNSITFSLLFFFLCY